MSIRWFAGPIPGLAVVNPVTGAWMPGDTGNVWDAATGGTQLTSLVDADGEAIPGGALFADAHGYVQRFGVDTDPVTEVVYIDFTGGTGARVRMECLDRATFRVELDDTGHIPVELLPDALSPNIASGKRVLTAAADGVTDDSAVIQAELTAAGAAITAGLLAQATVILPHSPTPYACESPLAFPNGVGMVGEGAATLKPTATMARLIDLAGKTDVTLERVGFDFGSEVTASGIRVGAGSVGVMLHGCRFTSGSAMPTAVYPVNIESGADRTTVHGCLFESVTRGLRLYLGHTNTTVSDNDFKDWGERGIQLLGSAAAASVDCTIVDNRFTDVTQDAIDRIPIAVRGASGAWHTRLLIDRNRVVGNGLPNHQTTDPGDPESGTQLGGTADAISVQWARDSVISNNFVSKSGEVGITVSFGCERVKVRGNTVNDSNSDGIAVGANGTTVTDIWVEDNSLTNSGKELGAVTPRTGAQAAIWYKNATGGSIKGNTCTDDQGTATQLAVMYLSSSTDVEIGHNPRRGGTTQLVLPASSGSTGLRFDIPPKRVTATGTEETRTDTTLEAHAQLQHLGLDPNAVYQVDAKIIYAASQAADAVFKWANIVGGAIQWDCLAPASNSTSASALFASQHSNLVMGNSFTVGGAGSGVLGQDVTAKIRAATLTTGSGGGDLVLTWAQNVADAAIPSVIRNGSWLEIKRIG